MSKIQLQSQQQETVENDTSISTQSTGQSSSQQTNPSERTKANGDGTIEIDGKTIGPFLGEWQGRPRNQIIASRLEEITSDDLNNTRIEPTSGGVRVYFGEIGLSLLSADIAAMGIEQTPGISTERTAGLLLIQQMGGQPPRKTLAKERGELALRQAKLTYTKGREQVGSGSWETRGSNSGHLIDELFKANHAGSGYEWCGMYVGHAYKKAGIRPEILRSLVFWSGYRLHLFFTRGVDVSNRAVGSFWQPHQYKDLPLNAGNRRREMLTEFDPKAGDVVLFGPSPFDHVAIVSSFNAETGVLELMEGNSGNRVQATAFGSTYGQISFIGRFNDSDYGGAVDSNLQKSQTPNVSHTDKRSGRVS